MQDIYVLLLRSHFPRFARLTRRNRCGGTFEESRRRLLRHFPALSIGGAALAFSPSWTSQYGGRAPASHQSDSTTMESKDYPAESDKVSAYRPRSLVVDSGLCRVMIRVHHHKTLADPPILQSLPDGGCGHSSRAVIRDSVRGEAGISSIFLQQVRHSNLQAV